MHRIFQIVNCIGFKVHHDGRNKIVYGQGLVEKPRAVSYRPYLAVAICTEQY